MGGGLFGSSEYPMWIWRSWPNSCDDAVAEMTGVTEWRLLAAAFAGRGSGPIDLASEWMGGGRPSELIFTDTGHYGSGSGWG